MNNIRRLLLLALAGLATTLSAASPEHQIGSTVVTPAPYVRGGVSVASDGTDYFAAWSDHRFAGTAGIVGSRITRDGRVLDPLGIQLGPAPWISEADTVWDGGAYLVVWTAWVMDDGGELAGEHIFAARVDREGRVVMQARIVASGASTHAGAVVSNGNVSVIAYRDNLPPYQARIMVLDRDGDTVHGEPLPVQELVNLAAAATPSQFVIIWGTQRPGIGAENDLAAVALTSDGHVTGTARALGHGNLHAMAANGSDFLVLSSERHSDGKSTLQARALRSDLALHDPQPVSVTEGYSLKTHSLFWRAGRYELLLVRTTHPSGQFETMWLDLGPSGAPLGTRTRDRKATAAATNGSEVAVVFAAEDPNAAAQQFFAATYRGNATAAETQELLSRSGNAQKNPVIAASPHGSLVAWNEEKGVYATRVGADGSSLDGRGVLLGSGFGVRVTFDGTNYAAVWRNGTGIGIRRIDPATGAIVAQAQVTAEWVDFLEVAASPVATYAVYAQAGRAFVARIPHATNVPDPILAVSPEDVAANDIGAAWNGSELLVVWNEGDGFRGDPPLALQGRVRGARVTASLTLLDPEPLVVADFGTANWPAFGTPAVASNGNDWLVLTEPGHDEIFARRVRRNGTVEGELTKIAQGDGFAAAWDGSRYAVVWNDFGTARVMTVAASGPLAPGRDQTVATSVTGAPAIAMAKGEAAIAYTKLSFLPEHGGVERTFLRFVVPGAVRGRVVRR